MMILHTKLLRIWQELKADECDPLTRLPGRPGPARWPIECWGRQVSDVGVFYLRA
ncbi:BQ5605_C005g03437 [Microbotryum silenes-dioicae]|uniref:BQ5605_C005g03437 protein n=1 Tax=Microbotryum silenes-dioicae TaxID=796604 RepID=A0A2X0PCU4_9BASI|nr:BQ5605_C005g03437 [Microbotryum silenes-dioicae]